MTAKPTILLVSFVFSPNIGGVESHLDDLCNYLTKKDYKIVVITYQPLITTNAKAHFIEKHKNLEIIRIPWIRFNLFNRLEKFPLLQILYLVPPILFYTFFYLMFNMKKIDVIQVHGFNMAFAGAILSAIFRKKLVVNTHVSFKFIKGSFYAKVLANVLNQASKILVLTHEAKRELVKIGVKKEKILLYRQWIDTTLFTPHDKLTSRDKLKLDRSKFIVFFAGRFVAAKGINLLLGASRNINSNVLFVFVGGGPLKDFMQKFAKKNSKIHFVGEIKKEELPYYYSAADICIIPSTPTTKTYSEGIPRVLVESFHCGTPVIATKTGGVKEFLNSDIGFFVKPKSNAITELINSLSTKQEELLAMRKNCIMFAKEQFSLSQNTAIVESTLT